MISFVRICKVEFMMLSMYLDIKSITKYRMKIESNVE